MTDMNPQFPDANLVLLGDPRVGKSCLAIRYMAGEYGTYFDPSTLDHPKVVCIDGTSFRVLLIELHDPYFASSHREVEHCHGAVLMYSITSRSSFETLPTWKENFLRLKRSTSFPMVLIATQCDAEGEKDRQVTPEEGRALAAQIGCPFLEVSSDDNNNVGDAINQVLGEVKAHHELQASLQIPPKEHRCIIS